MLLGVHVHTCPSAQETEAGLAGKINKNKNKIKVPASVTLDDLDPLDLIPLGHP